ncbi:etoposide-induced protein 2.4-like protein [Leptotrombidium deliense]|uniref:Etoposide-induced protein 2.4-like protein n=1 Tax=Leptotrombidium deliense TaxID=299467 RepID=A0A443SFY4_9ACAR|nr:etoposide-induced protein 2.4-like protein [Leptotrombidium deliense]
MCTTLETKLALSSMQHFKNVGFAVVLGLRDSLSGIAAIRHLRANDNVLNEEQRGVQRRRNNNNAIKRICECCFLNGGVFWLSIQAFECVLLPCLYWFMEIILGSSPGLLSSVWYWLQPLLSYTFGALWVLPLFMLSRIVNALWFQDIADSAYRGRSQLLRSKSKLIADTLFSLVCLLFSILSKSLLLFQSLMVTLLPISFLGQCFNLLHLSLLYSLYSFEYKWFNMGMFFLVNIFAN